MARYNDNIAAVAGLKYGAGLWVPNNQFRDVNATLHTGTKTGAISCPSPKTNTFS